MHSMQTMEHEIADSLSGEADVLIRPSAPMVSWVEFHRAKELIRKGESATEAKLEELKALVKQQNV